MHRQGRATFDRTGELLSYAYVLVKSRERYKVRGGGQRERRDVPGEGKSGPESFSREQRPDMKRSSFFYTLALFFLLCTAETRVSGER